MTKLSLIPALVAASLTLCLLSVPHTTAYPSEMPARFFSTDIVANLGTAVTDFCVLDAHRVIVLQRLGQVLMIKDGEIQWDLAMDLTDLVGAGIGDRGLTTCALHPDFAKNGWVYFGYVFDDEPGKPLGVKKNRISRFTLNGDKFDRASERILLGGCNNLKQGARDPLEGDDCMPMFGITHSIGWLGIGPDNNLWASVGEGIAWEGQDWNKTGYGLDWVGPMDPDYLNGKILRMDLDGNGLSDNPFWDGNPLSARSRVWAVGLRNPFRCNHVPGSPSYDLLCGQVGWFEMEAILIVKRGQNLGWPCYEGTHVPSFFNPATEGCAKFYNGDSPWPAWDSANVALEWPHNGQSACAIGGVFFSDKYPEAYQGSYLYADFSQEWMSTVVWDVAESKAISRPKNFAQTTDGPVKFTIGPDGWIWYLAQCVTCVSGGILRAITYGAAWKPAWGVTYRAETCERPLKLSLPALPAGWQTSMYLSDLPASYFTASTDKGEWRPANFTDSAANGGYVEGSSGSTVIAGGLAVKDSSIGTGAGDGGPMTVNGFRIRKGLGVHALNTLDIDLQGACYAIQLKAGIDDSALVLGQGAGELLVYMDENLRWNSTASNGNTALTAGKSPLMFDVGHLYSNGNLLGVKTLRLQAKTPPGLQASAGDRIDWGELRVFCGPDAPYVPRIFINSPSSDIIAKPGEVIFFSGGAKDWKGNAIPWQNLTFTVNIIHGQGTGSHIHPALYTFPQTGWGSFQVTEHTNNEHEFYYFEIRLDACDPKCARSCNFATAYVRVQG